MLKEFIYNLEDLKKEREKLRNLMYIIGKEYVMECQKCGYIFCIEFGITSERRPEILNDKSKHPYMKRSHCEEQLNILLSKINTNITKQYIDIIMRVFKNEKTFAIQSRPQKSILTVKDKKILWKNRTFLEISKDFIQRVLLKDPCTYFFMRQITHTDTHGIKLKKVIVF